MRDDMFYFFRAISLLLFLGQEVGYVGIAGTTGGSAGGIGISDMSTVTKIDPSGSSVIVSAIYFYLVGGTGPGCGLPPPGGKNPQP
jgi:hypothetical protein